MSLYRKYRPQIFGDIAGQEHIKTILQNEIIGGSTVHAYLFSGPRAVGKTTTARILVRALNCEKRKKNSPEPCNACLSCTALFSNTTLDVLEIDAASHTGVDNVRENIIAAARVGNTLLAWKAFIIDEVHMLSVAAFNALLKVIEEPPARVVFILATTEVHKVPATIVSRCQQFDFKKINPDAMAQRLKKLVKAEKRAVKDDVIDTIVRLSDGFQRDAESLLGQVLALPGATIAMEDASLILPRSNHELVRVLVASVIARTQGTALEIVDRLVEEGVDLPAFIDEVLDHFRNLLLLKNGVSDILRMPEKELVSMQEQSTAIETERVLACIQYFSDALRDAKWFTIHQLPLEMAIVKACIYASEKN